MWQKVLVLGLMGGVVALSLVPSSDLSLGSNLRSLAIVLGGTFLATLIAYPWRRFKELWALINEAYHPRQGQAEEALGQIVRLARIGRLKGLRALDGEAKRADNDIIRLGAELVADGRSRTEVREALDKEFEIFFSERESLINMLQTMGRLAPAFGLAGTVVGLIQMFDQLSNLNGIGAGMSVALLTTLYGIMVSNLAFLPLARKLKEHTAGEAMLLSLIQEGVMGIHDNEHASTLDNRLRALFINERGRRVIKVSRAAARPGRLASVPHLAADPGVGRAANDGLAGGR